MNTVSLRRSGIAYTADLFISLIDCLICFCLLRAEPDAFLLLCHFVILARLNKLNVTNLLYLPGIKRDSLAGRRNLWTTDKL